MHPWGITIKPCIGSKERTKNDLIRAFYSALDSILSARTRALKTLCAVLAWLVEPLNLITRTENNRRTDGTCFDVIRAHNSFERSPRERRKDAGSRTDTGCLLSADRSGKLEA